MKALTTLVLVGLTASVAMATSYDDENWDNPSLEHNKWTYWDEDFGTAPHHHRPMDYSATGGVSSSGYVSAPLEELEPALIHDGAAYWPAYPGEDMETTGFPYVNLNIPGAAVSVYVRGGHNPIGPPVDLGGGQVRFFIGYYDTKGNEISFGKMNPGEKADIINGSNEFSKYSVQANQYTSWKDGKLVLRNEPMTKVVQRINRWYNVNIILSDIELESYTYRATFVDENLDEVLKIFKNTSPINYKELGRNKLTDGSYGKRTIELFCSTK